MDAGVFEFRDQKLERSAGLTAADRKWMSTIVTDANGTWTRMRKFLIDQQECNSV